MGKRARFWVEGKVVKVRLFGIDAPEIKGALRVLEDTHPEGPTGLLELLKGARRIERKPAKRIDKYGRALARYWL